jgi:hypothetical protein
MKQVYIYILKDQNDNIRYVGKTTNIKRRLHSHIAEAKLNKSKRYVLNWIRQLLVNNNKPILQVIEKCNENNWQEREIYWINYYKKIVPNLCNLCNGGTGGLTKENLTEDQLRKKKTIMSNTFSKFSEEEKIHIWSLIQKGKSLQDICDIYSKYNRNIDFGVRNGRQWNDITNLSPIFKNSKRIGYTCRNGLFMIRKNIDGKTKVVYSSRNEEDIINYLNLDK